MNRIDTNLIQENYLLDETSTKELLKLFKKSVECDMQSIKKSLDSNDLNGIANIAHKLKASFAYVYLYELSDKFDELRFQILNHAGNNKIQKSIKEIESLTQRIIN